MNRKIRVLFKLLFLISLFVSCLDIRFEEPQPTNLSELDSIPVELVGKYVSKVGYSDYTLNLLQKQLKRNSKNGEDLPKLSKKDTLKISHNNFTTRLLNISKDSKKDWKIKRLNDSCFILSLLKEDTINKTDTWHVYPIVKRDSSLIIFSLQFVQSLKDSTLNKVKEIMHVNKVCHKMKKERKRKKAPDEYYKKSYYLVNPTYEEFETLIRNRIFKETEIYIKVNE